MLKMPWDKNYLKISFHFIFTAVIMYALFRCVDILTYAVINYAEIYKNISKFLRSAFTILSPVIIAFIIAYLLDPAAEFFQNKYETLFEKHLKTFWDKLKEVLKYVSVKLRAFNCSLTFGKRKALGQDKAEMPPASSSACETYKKRMAGALISYFFILIIIIVTAFFTIGKINEYGGQNTAESLALLIDDSVNEFYTAYRDIEDSFKGIGDYGYSSAYLSSFADSLTDFIKDAGTKFVKLIKAAGEAIPAFLISLVIAFYFIKDKQSINRKLAETARTLLPERIYTFIRNALEDIDAVFSGYIRGQLTDAFIMAVLISVSLFFIGIPSPFIIGTISGFFNLIPYFGALIGMALAVSAALLSGYPYKALYAAIAIIILEQIDGFFIIPKIVGENVRLNPVLVIIALLVCGNLFGIAGIIFAVPVFAVFNLFISRFLKRRKIMQVKEL